MQSKMTDGCCCCCCGGSGGAESPPLLFSFPLDPDRCKQWLDNCPRPDLASKDPEELHKLYKLCSKHFEPSLISHEGTSTGVLKDDAVPTVFDITEPSTNPPTSNRKRSGDLLEEEPASVKKSKDNAESPAVQQESEVSGENSTTCASQPQDHPVQEDPVQDHPVQEDPVQDHPVQEDPVQDHPVQDDPMQDAPMQEDSAIAKARESLKVYFKEVLALTGFSINGANVDEPMLDTRGRPALNPVCVEKIDQKEVLQFSEDLMRDEIQNSLQMARFFSILLQDATNMEGKEQIPVFVRAVTVEGFPQKYLIGFLPCELDTDNLFYTLLTELRNKWGLRMEHCRGLSYLVTGAMCQKIRDLSCRILQEFPQVVLSPIDPYVFNIWIIRCMPVPFIQKVADAVEEVAGLIRSTPELSLRLDGKIQMTYGHIKGRVEGIKEACRGNWEYCTDAFQTMLDILEPFLNCINEVISKVSEDTAEQLAKLRPTLKNFNFIVTLVVLKNTLCCVSILNSSLRGIISISSTLQYTISNALKLVTKYQQEIAIFHRKWFGDAMGRAKKLGVEVTGPEASLTLLGTEPATATETPLEDLFREHLSRPILQYLVAEVKRVLSVEMVRILRWLSLVPSYMADHNFSIRRDKVADANLNNLARPDTFYEELGYWELKWRQASKRRILPTTVFATLKIPDIAFYPNVQSLLRVLGTVPCVNAEADVYGQYNMVLERCQFYLKSTPQDQRRCHLAYVFVNQDVHFSVEQMVESYAKNHPEIMQLLQTENAVKEKQPKAVENDGNHAEKDNEDEPKGMTIEMEGEKLVALKCAETDREALKSALQAAVTAAYNSQSRLDADVSTAEQQECGVEYVSKSEMKEVLNVCENVVRDGILMEVGSAFFSLFIDRVVVFGEKEYLPLFLRFVDSFDVMRLELMGFAEAELECDELVQRLTEIVTKEWRLDLKYCRGQAYLGSGDIAYKLKAFACKIQEKSPLAFITHSSCYSFNTWWSKSIPVPAIKKTLDVFEEVLMFFGSSSALEKQVDHVIAYGLRESSEKVQELQGNFCSLWQVKHDSYEVFVQIMEPLVECLEKIKNNPQRWKESVSGQAGELLRKIMDFDFIIAMVILKNTSSFTKELSSGLQKDHFSAASQLCQITGILATLNRVKTNLKVFHQNWFDEACAVAQSLRVQIEDPENPSQPRDAVRKPQGYFKDALSIPIMDNLMTALKDHFSEDHKEALTFLALVPCSVTVSYMFESLKSKPPLYSTDLPDADNFFTELCCWRVKWKTKVTLTIPDTIFHTLRLPIMQYFGNINTLLRIMSVLPSTTLEDCGAKMRHKMFQEYLKNTSPKDRSPCLAMLQVGTDFHRDLDRMVTQCLKVTPQTLEGICLDKETKTLMKNSENNMEVDHLKDAEPELTIPPPVDVPEDQDARPAEANGHAGMGDNQQSLETVFRLAALLALLGKKGGTPLAEMATEEAEAVVQELGMCHWLGGEDKGKLGEAEIAALLTKGIRDVILQEIQESPYFSLITDRPVRVSDGSYLPVFVRYVGGLAPKVELLGFLPFDETCDDDNSQAKALARILTEEWGLPMSQCRGQAYMHLGSGCQSLKILSLDFLKSYPLAVVTPSESCGLAYWLAGRVPCPPVTRMLDVAEDLLLFFDRTPGLEGQLAQAVDVLLNAPREALEESPETCCSRWKKREDFFDALADTLEGILSCLDSVSAGDAATGSTLLYAQVLATAVRSMDFIVTLVILRNACAPLRNCSTVFRCGNPADIIGEVEKIPQIIEALSKMLENISTVHGPWFDHAFQLASKVGPEQVCFPEEAGNYESVEVFYRETLSIPILKCLIEEMKHSFSESHLQALSVLSLLPSCNPQSSLESTDKPFGLYLTDLPDPDNAEMEFNAWAVAWREKYQDTAPPASISETLLHPESKSHPTVTSLLRLVAVLPSVSIECDLMKSTLNAMRDLLQGTVCRGSRTDRVMLLTHRQTLQRLPEVIEKCMEQDPESRPCLTQVMETFQGLQLVKGAAKVNSMEEEMSSPAVADPPSDTVVAGKPEGNGVAPDGLPESRTPMCFYDPQLREEMIKELWESQFFTVIIEQAVEVDGELYVPLGIRYLIKEDIQCEETLAFIPYNTDAGALADAFETVLSEKWGLSMASCRGVSLLSIGQVGVQMRAVCTAIATKYPQAVRAVSSAVSLSVWLARSSPVAEVADGVALTENVLQWFTADARRQNRLEDAILRAFPRDEAKGNELRDKLVKSWEKCHNVQELVLELLESLLLCLNELRDEGSSRTERRQASDFYNALWNFEFIFSTVVEKHVLAVTNKLSGSLQGKPLDMLLAINTLPELNEALCKLRNDIDVHHKAWFEEAVALAAKLQVATLHPVLLEPLSDFYVESVSMKAIEHSISEVADLFTEKVLDNLQALEIVPYAMSKVETPTFGGLLFRLYSEDLPDKVSLFQEIKTWKEKWLDPLAGYLPTTVLDTLKTSQIRSFSNIETLLRLQVILPFSRKESSFRVGRRSLQAFMQQQKRSLAELHPL